MKMRTKIVIAATAATAVAAGGIGVAVAGATSDDDGSEVPITGTALDEATAAALRVTGGGTVTETEVGDEEGFYEVEVTLPDGGQVDVHLDEDFRHLGSEHDGVDDETGADDD